MIFKYSSLPSHLPRRRLGRAGRGRPGRRQGQGQSQSLAARDACDGDLERRGVATSKHPTAGEGKGGRTLGKVSGGWGPIGLGILKETWLIQMWFNG